MAEIRKIVRSPSLSNFTNVAPEAGGVFRILGQAAETAFERLRPAAIKEQEDLGTEAGHEWFRGQFGDPLASQGTGGGGNYRAAIQKVESGGNYGALGPVTKSGDRAYGAYQVMGANIGPWTEKHFGRRLTADEFLASREAQDAVFDGEFGSYLRRFGNPQDAASMWFSGRKMSEAGNASDGYNTTPEYVRKFTEALGPEVARADTQPTVIRTASGKLEPRLYSPLAGEILAAHDAAAGVAYTSDVMLKGMTDMMALSEQFPLDPEGFRGAARAYVDEMVSKAPDRFRSDIRASLEKEMTRRFLGVTEEKQADTRQRANNSSAALIERWTDNLSEAMASGNKDEIDSARTELDSLLYARERLIGVAWTPEQSQNVILKAKEGADRIVAARSSEARKQNEGFLETIIASAKEGLHTGNEAILSDPAIQAALPDLWEKAVGAVTIRDWLPTFRSATPEQQAATIADMRGKPVESDMQVSVIKAAEDAHAESRKAWESDPIGYAAKVLPQKPPPLPDLASGDEKTFVNALKARREYAKGLRAQGYVDFDAFLSDAEAKDLGLLMGKETPPEVRLAMASALVAGFGDDAAKVLSEIKSNDPTTLYAGMLVARGGDPVIATEAMQGQLLLDEKLVTLPDAAERRGAITPGMASALLAAGVDGDKQGKLMSFANAIYASRARNLDQKSQEAIQIMRESVQAALGQKESRRDGPTGGIQTVGGNDVLLPVGVAGTRFQDALEKAFTTGPKMEQSFLQSLDMFSETYLPQQNEAMWKSAEAPSVPMLGGKPLDFATFKDGHVRLVPMPFSKTRYRMEVVTETAQTDVRDADGKVFTFDAMKLIEAVK